MMSTIDSNGRADRALKTVQWNMCVSSERQLMAIASAYAGTVYCILFAWFGLRRFLHGMGSQLAPPKNDKPERETQWLLPELFRRDFLWFPPWTAILCTILCTKPVPEPCQPGAAHGVLASCLALDFVARQLVDLVLSMKNYQVISTLHDPGNRHKQTERIWTSHLLLRFWSFFGEESSRKSRNRSSHIWFSYGTGRCGYLAGQPAPILRRPGIES